MRLRDLVGAAVLGLLAPAAGIGLLYLLRAADVAATGSHVPGALPLESLAGDDAQPLARVVLAWLPVGLVVGALLASFTRTRFAPLVVVTVVAGAVLVLNVGVSISVENNQPLTKHLGSGFHESGAWVSLALLFISAAVAVGVGSSRGRAPSAP